MLALAVTLLVIGGSRFVEYRIDRQLERLEERLKPGLALAWDGVAFDPFRWETVVTDVRALESDGSLRFGMDSLVVRQWALKGAESRIRMESRGLVVGWDDGVLGWLFGLFDQDGVNVGLSLRHSTATRRMELESLTLEAPDIGKLGVSIRLDGIPSIVARDSVPLLDRIRHGTFAGGRIWIEDGGIMERYITRRAETDGITEEEVRSAALSGIRFAAFFLGLGDEASQEHIRAFIEEGDPLGMVIGSRSEVTVGWLLERMDGQLLEVLGMITVRLDGGGAGIAALDGGGNGATGGGSDGG